MENSYISSLYDAESDAIRRNEYYSKFSKSRNHIINGFHLV